jgi:diacylglycerol kinase (ATP)
MEFTTRVWRRISAEPAPAAGESSGARGHASALPKVGVLRNPRSHRNKRRVPEANPFPELLVATPGTRPELVRALQSFAAEGVAILVIDGGDGTIRDVLTCGAAVFGTRWPKLAVLPKGKTNALAVDLGVPRDWTLEGALAAALGGDMVRRRPLIVEQGDGSALWGFIFGTGACNAAIATGQTAHRLGAFQSFAIAVATVFGLGQALFGVGNGPWRRTVAMRLEAGSGGDELPHSGRFDPRRRYLAMFSTLRSFPLGMRPFRDSDSDIRYLILDAPLRRVIAMLPVILRGTDLPLFARLGVHRGSAETFSLATEDRFILDGEGFPPGSIRLRQGPELRFIVP